MASKFNGYAYWHQPKETKKFKDYVVFARFLKELLRHCSAELQRFQSPNDMKALVNHNAMIPFKDILLDPNFELRWTALSDKCPQIGLQSTGSMKDEAVNIKNGLVKQGSLLKHFGDFPPPPDKTLADLKRFYQELLALKRNGKKKYNLNQRSYINGSLANVKKKLISMNAHEQCQEDEDQQPIFQKRNAEQAFGDGDTYQARLPKDVRPPEKRANIEVPPGSASNEPPFLQCTNKMKAVDFFIIANPDLSKEEAVKKFCYLSLDVRTLFDNLEKNQDKLL